MRPLAKAATIGIAAATVFIALLFILIPYWESFVPDGFEKEDLKAPSLTIGPALVAWTGSPVATSPPSKDFSMRWWITPVYSGFGGSLNITLTNTGNTKLHIYSVGIEWPDHSISTYKVVNVNITKGRSADLGAIYFQAPSGVSSADYAIVISLSAQNKFGAWYDFGEVRSERHSSEILPLGTDRSYDITDNPVRYFKRVNDLVEADAVKNIVQGFDIASSYDIQEVVAAFDWVRSNIKYVNDPNDVWLSASETIAQGGGDCEDQALLLCSMVLELGGNARMNFIKGHAFATVYVGDTPGTMQQVQDAISSHYGLEVRAFFLIDALGYWLVLDSTSYHYCGGMPTLSVPTGLGINDFAFEDTDFLYTIDIV
ncbi:MAG: transglutaminase family protein [Methanomassiliicoccales archaeon]|nr:MAG: transglutaminase family protein [Methanomassiliicoccales archaeon]